MPVSRTLTEPDDVSPSAPLKIGRLSPLLAAAAASVAVAAVPSPTPGTLATYHRVGVVRPEVRLAAPGGTGPKVPVGDDRRH